MSRSHLVVDMQGEAHCDPLNSLMLLVRALLVSAAMLVHGLQASWSSWCAS